MVMVAAAAAMFSDPSRVRAQTGQDNSVRAVREVLDRQVVDWNRGDLDAFLAGYWNSPKVVFQSGGQRFDGWEAMRDRYRRRYRAEGKAMGRLGFSSLEIEPLSPESMLVRGGWRLTMPDGKKPGGLFTLIVRKFPDGWKIVHDHTSAEEPARTAPIDKPSSVVEAFGFAGQVDLASGLFVAGATSPVGHLGISVFGVVAGRMMAASTRPARNQPMISSRAAPMMKSVGKAYQFQYDTRMLTNPKRPIAVTMSTRPKVARPDLGEHQSGQKGGDNAAPELGQQLAGRHAFASLGMNHHHARRTLPQLGHVGLGF